MSVGVTDTQPPRRVRHQARDAALLMAFSAAVSLGLTLLAMLAMSLGQQG